MIARAFPATALLLALAACATSAPESALPPAPLSPNCVPPAESALVIELIFGRSIPGGGEVTEREWQRYLADEVTPRFPDGLTVLDGQGQWRSGGVIDHEDSKVLLLLSPLPGSRAMPALPAGEREERLAALVEAYRQRFRQNAVLRIDTPGCYRFYEYRP